MLPSHLAFNSLSRVKYRSHTTLWYALIKNSLFVTLTHQCTCLQILCNFYLNNIGVRIICATFPEKLKLNLFIKFTERSKQLNFIFGDSNLHLVWNIHIILYKYRIMCRIIIRNVIWNKYFTTMIISHWAEILRAPRYFMLHNSSFKILKRKTCSRDYFQRYDILPPRSQFRLIRNQSRAWKTLVRWQ